MTVAQFWGRVERQNGGCWPWTGATTQDGYGQTWVHGYGKDGAHRMAYRLEVGPIPDGLVIDHLCRNRACCNPAHLEAVTVAENVRRTLPYQPHGSDTLNGAKTHCPQGHPYDEVNTLVIPSRPTARYCRQCQRDHQRRYRAAS